MLRVIQDSVDSPALDTAVSNAILRRVAAGDAPATLRLFVPGRIVAFGRQDTVRPGYRRAAAVVAQTGFAAVERLAGGKAAVFHEGTLAFAWAVPDDRTPTSLVERFQGIAAIVADALHGLGVDARIGEVPGEYCPGAYSVNARGTHKLMGVGQRLIRGAAHLGGVVVVDHAERVNLPLIPAYEALGYDWDPGATGAIDREVATDVGEVRRALLDAFTRAGHDLVESSLDTETLAMASGLADGHEIA